MTRTLVLAAAVVLGAAPVALADHTASALAGGGAGPINTMAADTLPEGLFSVCWQVEELDLTTFSNAELTAFAAQNIDAHSVDRMLVHSVCFEYGVSDEGALFETEFQPGSGSVDPLLGLAVTRRFGSASLSASVLGVFTTEGSQDTELGDIRTYNLGYAWRLGGEEPRAHGPPGAEAGTAWDLILELNAVHRQAETIDASRTPTAKARACSSRRACAQPSTNAGRPTPPSASRSPRTSTARSRRRTCAPWPA